MAHIAKASATQYHSKPALMDEPSYLFPVYLNYFHRYALIYEDANVLLLFILYREILTSFKNSNLSVRHSVKKRPASLLKLQIWVSLFIILFLFMEQKNLNTIRYLLIFVTLFASWRKL